MRTLVLTAAVATALGAFAAVPANAGSGIKITGPWSGGSDCRTVERTVYRDGMRKTVREKQCGDRSASRYDRDRYEERRYTDRSYDRDYHRDRDYDRRDSGGVNLNIGR